MQKPEFKVKYSRKRGSNFDKREEGEARVDEPTPKSG
jgi:hypothetical protein